MRNIQCPTKEWDEARYLRGNNDGDVEAGFWIATLIQCRGVFGVVRHNNTESKMRL